MNLKLLTVSKQCSEIISESGIKIDNVDNPTIEELYQKIYRNHPTLFPDEDYKLYWLYAKTTFLPINDHLTYVTALTLTVTKNVYLLLNDCDEFCEQNEFYIRKLDRIEIEEQKERERDIYDVRIGKKEEPVEEEEPDAFDAEPRCDTEILNFALRKLPVGKLFTRDFAMNLNFVNDVKKGWPKLKNKLVPLDEEVIVRVVKKDKGKKGKKGKKGGKDKKKGAKKKGK